MAFGGRELRLILSIQSYGTGNIQRLRRDITQLGAFTKAANANQLAVQNQIVSQTQKAAEATRRMTALEKQRLAASGIGPLRQREKLMDRLNKIGYRGISIQKGLAGTMKINNAEARAIFNTLRAQDMTLSNINRDLGIQSGIYDEITAEVRLLNSQELKRAAILDKQVAALTRQRNLEVRARGVAHAGRTAQFAGLIGVAGTVALGSAAARFSQQSTLAATQMRELGQSAKDVPGLMEDLTHGLDQGGQHFEGILELMKQFPASADEMTQSAYDIYSGMTVTEAGGLKLLKLFNQLAVATGTDLPTATNAGITVLNDFGGSIGNAGEKLNLMMSIVRFGRMTLTDLNEMFNKVAPAALAAGQSLEDVAGAMVLITRVQPSQRIGATGIARLLQTFRDPDFQRGIFKVSEGVLNITKNATGVGELKPLPKIIDDMAKSFGLFEEFGGPQQLFKTLTAVGKGSGIGRQSRIEAANAFTFLIGFNNRYQKLQRRTIANQDEFSESLKALGGAPGVQWAVFVNGMKAFAITLGEDLLPVLLQVAAFVTRAADWFEGLNKGSRKTIATWLVWGSVAGVIIGTLTNLGASMVAFAANLRIVRGELALTGTAAGGAGQKMTAMAIGAKALSAIGVISIPIIMQAIRGGDPGVWDLLMAAGFGALGGSAFGPAGAIVGAITVPLAVMIQAELGKGPVIPPEATKEIKNAYTKYWESLQQSTPRRIFNAIAPFSAKPQVKEFKEWIKEHPRYLKIIRTQAKKHNVDQEDIITNFNKNFKAQMKEYGQALVDAGNAQNTQLTKQQQKEIQLRKAHADAVKQAMENQENTVKSAVDNMEQLYEQMWQDNKNALGALGQGPVMQGMLGSIFSDINDQLRQFGVQIPVPFSIIKQDFDMQLDYFKRWRKDLAALAKRGVPAEFLAEIQAMGPAAGIPFAEGLLKEGKQGFKGLVKEYEDVQDLLDTATKEDLDRKLKYWNQYGKDAAWQMIQGLIHNPRNAQLREQFEKYIHSNFGSALKDAFDKDVAEAMAAAREQIAAGLATIPDAPKVPTGGGPGGVTPAQRLAQAQRAEKETKRQLRTLPGPISSMKQWMVDPRSPGGQLVVPEEAQTLQKLLTRQKRLRGQLVGQQREQVRLQMTQQERRKPGRDNYVIHYHGDEFKVSAELTAAQFVRLARNRSWRSRHKVPRK